MRAHQIMTRSVTTVAPDATILEAANIMLRQHVSGLPVVDAAGKLVGIVSEGDFIRRSEIGTQRKRGRWLKFLLVGVHAVAATPLQVSAHMMLPGPPIGGASTSSRIAR